jgi:hypothetical protein
MEVRGFLVINHVEGKAEFNPESGEAIAGSDSGFMWAELIKPYRLIAFIKRFRVPLDHVTGVARVYLIDVDSESLRAWFAGK